METYWIGEGVSINTNLRNTNKTDVTDIDKFNYLKSLICDEANETIAGLTLSPANYVQAIELLDVTTTSPPRKALRSER